MVLEKTILSGPVGLFISKVSSSVVLCFLFSKPICSVVNENTVKKLIEEFGFFSV